MGYHNPRPLFPNTHDPSAVDFRAFYPYTPNEVKHRKRTTTHQLKVLEAVFKRDTKPNAQLRQELASGLEMTARGVQVWFQNRRAKEKAKAGRVSLAGKPSDELREQDLDDLHPIIKAEVLPAEFLLKDDSPYEDHLDASSSPLSDANPPPPTTSSSPPDLRVITDAAIFCWATSDDPNDPPPDSATFCPSSSLPTTMPLPNTRPRPGLDLNPQGLYSLRRGSLPVTSALYPAKPSQHLHSPDPLVRRGSVDASLQRLALHPYASFARAKNTALYGAGVGVASSDLTSPDVPPSADGLSHYHLMNNRHYGPHRLQRRFVSSSALSAAAQYGSSLSTSHYPDMRRMSVDSRPLRISSLQRSHHSPSPSPLSTLSPRMSFPDRHLYSFTARPVGSPIPGPLPMPGFQFGAANSSTPSIASPSSLDSERNSPDSITSFSFSADEENQSSPPYDIYSSRFSSVASVATSDSSLNSFYYGGPTIDQDRRNSVCTPQYYTSPPDLDVGISDVHTIGIGNEMGTPTVIVAGYSSPEEVAPYRATDGVSVSISDMQILQAEQQHQPYVTPAVSEVKDIPGMPVTSSSELAYALDKAPEMPINDVTHSSMPGTYVNFAEQSSAEHYHAHQQVTTYLSTDVQTYHQQPVYPATYPFTVDGQVAEQPSDFGIYPTTSDYSDPLVPPDSLQTSETLASF